MLQRRLADTAVMTLLESGYPRETARLMVKITPKILRYVDAYLSSSVSSLSAEETLGSTTAMYWLVAVAVLIVRGRESKTKSKVDLQRRFWVSSFPFWSGCCAFSMQLPSDGSWDTRDGWLILAKKIWAVRRGHVGVSVTVSEEASMVMCSSQNLLMKDGSDVGGVLSSSGERDEGVPSFNISSVECLVYISVYEQSSFSCTLQCKL